MTRWQQFYIWIGCISTFLYFKLRISQMWSRFYEFVWDRKKSMELKRFANEDTLVAYVRNLKWRPDTWRELGDATSSPENVQWLAENEPHKLIGDCDEFGHFQAAVVLNEMAKGNTLYVRGLRIATARLFTVMWYDFGADSMGPGGHNVCALTLEDGSLCYQDYGFPSQSVKSYQELADLVRARYAPNNEPMGHVVSVPWSLKPEIVKYRG